MSSVLRLGVYRERIEKYGSSRPPPPPPPPPPPGPHLTKHQKAEQQQPPKPPRPPPLASSNKAGEELLTVTLEKHPCRPLGLRLSANCSEQGIFIVDIAEDSSTGLDGRLMRFDRLLFVNGQDVRHCKLAQASSLVQVRHSEQLI